MSMDAGSPARGLHELALEQGKTGAPVLVVGSTHRGPIGRVVLGSVGELLCSGAPCPRWWSPPAGSRNRPRRPLATWWSGLMCILFRVARGSPRRRRARARGRLGASRGRCGSPLHLAQRRQARSWPKHSRRGWTKPSRARRRRRHERRRGRSGRSARRGGKGGRHPGAGRSRLRADALRACGQCLGEAHALRPLPGDDPAAFGPRPRCGRRRRRWRASNPRDACAARGAGPSALPGAVRGSARSGRLGGVRA